MTDEKTVIPWHGIDFEYSRFSIDVAGEKYEFPRSERRYVGPKAFDITIMGYYFSRRKVNGIERTLLKWNYGPEFLDFVNAYRNYYTNKGFDRVALWTGWERSGKSSACILRNKLSDGTLDTSRICYSLEELFEVYKTAEKGQSIIVDEAGYAASRREWYDKDQKELIKVLQVAAARGVNLEFVTPHPDYFSKIISSYRLEDWFRVFASGTEMDRGFVEWSTASRKHYQGGSEPFWVNRDIFWVPYLGDVFPHLNRSYLDKKNRFIGEALAIRSKKSEIEEVQKKLSATKKENLAMRNSFIKELSRLGISQKEIARRLDLDPSRVSQILSGEEA